MSTPVFRKAPVDVWVVDGLQPLFLHLWVFGETENWLTVTTTSWEQAILVLHLGRHLKSLPRILVHLIKKAKKRVLKILAFFDRTVRIYVVWRHQLWKWRHSKRSRSSLSRPAFRFNQSQTTRDFSGQSENWFDAFRLKWRKQKHITENTWCPLNNLEVVEEIEEVEEVLKSPFKAARHRGCRE